MNIDAIIHGIVIDHIKAGSSMQIYYLLELDKLDCSVAIIKNVPSKMRGKKDIIKIDTDIDVDLNMLGFIDPNITINYIENGVVSSKQHLKLPQQIKNVLKCKNPRCITSVEQDLEHVFKLTDPERGEYRCIYCETKADKKG